VYAVSAGCWQVLWLMHYCIAESSAANFGFLAEAAAAAGAYQ
jgi:hypothetical protein